jgi:hypothetical protein
MSTVHRILLTAFARSDRRVAARAAGGRPAAGRPVAGRLRAGDSGAATRHSLGHDILTCTPWAGLYVEGPDAS